MLTTEQQNIIINYFKDKPVKKVMLFGSYSRGDEDENSDIDLLVTMDENAKVGLFGFAGYQIDLEESLKKKIDLGTQVSERIFKRIQNEIKVIYEKG